MKSLILIPFIRDSFENYQKSACGITLDIGRQRINRKELLSLIDFVKEKKMIESFNEMRKGKIVNASEHRSAPEFELESQLFRGDCSRYRHGLPSGIQRQSQQTSFRRSWV